jgi:hypothetical protein
VESPRLISVIPEALVGARLPRSVPSGLQSRQVMEVAVADVDTQRH